MATFCLVHRAWPDATCWEPDPAVLAALLDRLACERTERGDPAAGAQSPTG